MSDTIHICSETCVLYGCAFIKWVDWVKRYEWVDWVNRDDPGWGRPVIEATAREITGRELGVGKNGGVYPGNGC